MGLFLDDIRNQMADVNLEEAKSPREDVGEFEKVVGTLPDPLKRLWTIVEKFREATLSLVGNFVTMAAHEKERGEDTPLSPELEQEIRKSNFLLEKLTMMKQLFWIEVNTAFPGTIGKNAGVRKDWQVVISPPQSRVIPIPFPFPFTMNAPENED